MPTHYYNIWKRGLKAALSVSLVAVIASCSIGSYESGDGQYSYYCADMTILPTDKEKTDKGILDDDRTIILAKPISTAPLKKEYKQFIHNDSIRMMLFYNKSAESATTVEGTALSFIPVFQPKVALSDTIKTEQKTDPVNFISAWKSKNGKYYNLNLSVKTGVADEQKSHILGIVCDSVSQASLSAADDSSSKKTTLHIRLTHNQNNMPLYYTTELYLSLTRDQLLSILEHYGIKPSSDIEVIFTLNTFKGEEHVRM